jgi:hypothetical protein
VLTWVEDLAAQNEQGDPPANPSAAPYRGLPS